MKLGDSKTNLIYRAFDKTKGYYLINYNSNFDEVGDFTSKDELACHLTEWYGEEVCAQHFEIHGIRFTEERIE